MRKVTIETAAGMEVAVGTAAAALAAVVGKMQVADQTVAVATTMCKETAGKSEPCL